MDHRDKLVILHLNRKDTECSCFFTRDRSVKTRGFCNTEKKKYSGENICMLIMESLCFPPRDNPFLALSSQVSLSAASLSQPHCHLANLKL